MGYPALSIMGDLAVDHCYVSLKDFSVLEYEISKKSIK